MRVSRRRSQKSLFTRRTLAALALGLCCGILLGFFAWWMVENVIVACCAFVVPPTMFMVVAIKV